MNEQRKVLVVDDDPVVGESFNRVLSRKGYAVITAANGDEALAKMQAERYDLVFTDLRMPGMDGLEVAEQVKARQPWTPVVIVTGYGSKPSEDRARAIGVSEFLNKPLSPEMIEDSAAKALAATPVAAPPVATVATPAAVEAAPPPKPNVLKNMALFLLAPFIGLLYAVLLPFVGIGMLVWTALKKEDRGTAARPE
jgi:CheY-like chemotaxis protein